LRQSEGQTAPLLPFDMRLQILFFAQRMQRICISPNAAKFNAPLEMPKCFNLM
jgi:hypothetical protein